MAAPTYVIQHGLRYVKPYIRVFKAYAKRRWIGRTVVDVMSSEFPALANGQYLQGAIASGRIRVNGSPCVEGTVFRDGDLLEHARLIDEPPVLGSRPRDWLLYQDDEVVVVNKPASVPVHRAGRFINNTVLSILTCECADMVLRPGDALRCVHRLDRETSGLLVVAKTTRAARRLGGDFQDGRVTKRYLALVDGAFPSGTHAVDAPLKGTVHNGSGRNVVDKSGRSAYTSFRSLRYDQERNVSVVLCLPRTGRTHQIRLHLSWMGHPITDDALYGGSSARAKSHNLLYQHSQHVGPGSPSTAAEAERLGPHPGAMATAESMHGACIALHALDYRCAGAWHYSAPLPEWAARYAIQGRELGEGSW